MADRVKQVLKDIGYTDDEIFLEAIGGKVAGHIISEAFRGESQIDRQNHLWAALEARLGPEELRSIAAILTMTPTEVAS